VYYQQHGSLKKKTTAMQDISHIREAVRMRKKLRAEAVANRRAFRELPDFVEMEIDTMGNAM